VANRKVCNCLRCEYIEFQVGSLSIGKEDTSISVASIVQLLNAGYTPQGYFNDNI